MSLADLVDFFIDTVTPRRDARLAQLELFLARTLGNDGMKLLEVSELYAQTASVRGAAVGVMLGIVFAGLSGIDPVYATVEGMGLVSAAYRLQCDTSALPYVKNHRSETGGM